MAEQHEPPGSFGIETAVGKLRTHLDQLLGGQHRETHAAWRRIEAALGRLERKLSTMPTRAEFDAAKQALGQAISDATTRVTNDIQALRDQLANGVQVTDQDLADIQNDLGLVGQIDPAVVPPPTP